MQKVSFIITTRNEPEVILRSTIYSLLATSGKHPREIIVVDDGSETPVDFAHPEVAILRNATPAGVSPARHQGALAATGDIFVWLDAHMQFAPDWLDLMLAEAGSGALLCSEFWDYELRTRYCSGADFTWCCERDYWKQLSPGFGLNHRAEAVTGPSVAVPLIIGACYMMRRQSYDRTGGFSPLFRAWGVDDQDISVKAWLTGLGVRCVVDARVGHWTRSQFPYPVSFDHLEYNQLILIRTAFEKITVEQMESCFQPLPADVARWLGEANVEPWRTAVQANRQITDKEFFARIALNLTDFDA